MARVLRYAPLQYAMLSSRLLLSHSEFWACLVWEYRQTEGFSGDW